MKKALLVIDLQNDYFCGGKQELKGASKALTQANELIEYSREKKYKIFFIQHFSTSATATFFIPQTNGVELHEKLDFNNDVIVKKNYPNSFRDTSLQAQLDKEEVEELLICGAMTHMCIDSTVRAGFDLGYKITLASDACATRDLRFNQKVIKAEDIQRCFMASLDGLFCEVKTVKEIRT